MALAVHQRVPQLYHMHMFYIYINRKANGNDTRSISQVASQKIHVANETLQNP